MRFFSLANTFPLLLVVSFSTGDLFINSATAEDIPNNACGLQSAVLGSATSTPESAASPFHDTAPGMRTDPPSLNEGDFQPDQTSCTLCIDDFYDCRLQYYRVCQVSGRRGDTCRERFARHCHNEYEDCMANCEQPSQGVSDPNSQHGPLPPPPAPPEIQGDDQFHQGSIAAAAIADDEGSWEVETQGQAGNRILVTSVKESYPRYSNQPMQSQGLASESWPYQAPGHRLGSNVPRTSDLCKHAEGWGPLSPSRYDLTPCFEYSVLFGAVSLIAILGFTIRIYYLTHHAKAHNFGRTAWIYWPTQLCMGLGALMACTLSTAHFSSENSSPIFSWSCLSMGAAWALAMILNHFEHIYEIRSSSAIFSFYTAALAASLTIINTALDLEPIFGSILKLLTVFTSILAAGFVLEAWPRGRTQVQQRSGASLYGRANLFSRLTFFFFQPIIAIGLRRPLTQQDIMGQLPESMSAERGFRSLSRAWSNRLKKHRKFADQPSLLWTILIKDWELLIPVLMSRIAIVLFSYTLPILLRELLGYLEDYESKPVSYGLTLAVGMFVASLFASLLNTYNRYQMLTIGVTYRAALISMIYRKALRLSPGSRTESTSGEIANHMSVDADVFWDCLVPLSTWITIPIEIFIAMRLLYGLLGWTMLAGVLVMVLMLPLQAWQARIYESMQHKKLKAMDQRIRLTTEILGSMKIVKLYGWSSAFLKRILSIRQMELEALRKLGIVQAFMSIVFISSSLIISLITFAVYTLWGGPGMTPGKLTPQTVFVSMTLFAMLRNPISSLSDATTTTISLVVATKRIQQFLMREEVNEQDVLRFDGLPGDNRDPVISLVDATFSWTGPTPVKEMLRTAPDERTALLEESDHQSQDPTVPTLSSINLTVGRGSLTAVVGRVGQGKSSLLSAIIGDMYKLDGRVQISGRVAYVPQQAWITNASLRDNVLFGTEYNETRYKQVLCACGLEPDLAMLPAGDATEIGERGINLSGGQKQRVSLARAAYADAHIYLLDDPLSAVDAHVDRHLWDELLGPSGLLNDKTRILVTHGIHHLQEVDQIVVLKDGLVAEKGTYVELMAGRRAFYTLIKDYTMLERRRSHSALPLERRSSQDSGAGESGALDDDSQEDNNDDRQQSAEEVATDQWTLQGEASETTTRQSIKDEKKDTKAALIVAETIAQGDVGADIVLAYAEAASYRNAAFIFILFLLAQGCLVSTSLWLRHWIKVTKSSNDDNPPSLALFLGVYGALTFVYVLIYVVVMWLGFAVARIQASEKIHARLLDKILRLPISFFDTTPLGRIINRFSSDIFAVDIRIPNKLMDVLLFGISVSSTLLLIVFTTPMFTFLLPFLIAGYWYVQMCFLGVSRILVRIYSVSKSPVYQYFNESLDGVSTIRAMGVSDRFAEKCVALTDRMSNNFLSNMSSRRWLDVQLRLLSTIVLLCAAVFAVFQREHLDPSLVGLSLSFALTLTEEVTTLVRNFCDLQNQLVSLERVLEYTELRTEAPDVTDIHLPPNWPAEGRISFHNYSTRYREGLDLVIKNVTLVISPAEKVGIVGRTGAGKSSLTLALFRIVEAANSYWARESDNSDAAVMDFGVQEDHDSETQHGPNEEEEDGGRIEIDGVDISTVGLQQLRQHLSIIPQDPTLFAGTVRDNLDPFQELDDAELWQALERSHLKSYISMLPGGLHFEVSQNGENFSVGQRSLICLARALLRKTKILVMDEATAAVDVETDELIQRTIRTEFKDRTILTIAHRIKTVTDSDKILVLERGRVQEFDSPGKLLENSESLFFRLAHQAGEA